MVAFLATNALIGQVKLTPFVPIDSVSLDANSFAIENYLTQRKIERNLIQKVDFKCAVLIYPDKDQVKDLESQGEEAYNTIVDDGNYYQGMAIGILDSLHIKTIVAKKRFILFKGKQQWLLDIRKKNLPYWNLIFFMPNSIPTIVDAVGLEFDTVNKYFNIIEK